MSESNKSLFTKNLFLRVLSAFVLIPIVLGAVWMGEWAFFALILLISTLGMREWMALTAPNMSVRGKVWAYLSLIFVLQVGYLKGMPQAVGLSVLAALLMGYYGGSAVKKAKEKKAARIWSAMAMPYLGWSGLAMIHLRNVPDHGLALLVYLLLVVWATDTGAYFTGRMIGGPKLIPSISPNKTWAGLIGGMALAGLIGYGVALGFDESSTFIAAGVAVVMAVVSQAGDFFESYVKRRVGAKDSGSIIPGHGGILDRVDGLLFAAIFLALIVQLKV